MKISSTWKMTREGLTLHGGFQAVQGDAAVSNCMHKQIALHVVYVQLKSKRFSEGIFHSEFCFYFERLLIVYDLELSQSCEQNFIFSSAHYNSIDWDWIQLENQTNPPRSNPYDDSTATTTLDCRHEKLGNSSRLFSVPQFYAQHELGWSFEILSRDLHKKAFLVRL